MRQTPDRLELPTPDDLHLHLRDTAILRAVLPWTARQFGRGLVMPNLETPVTTTATAAAYRERILAALGSGPDFEPLMTLYLTDETSPEEIRRAKASGLVFAAKLYPAGVTTHSAAGVTGLERVFDAMEALQDAGLILSVHGEVADSDVDIFDREAVFLERHLAPLLERFTTLRVVLEHVTTSEGVAFVRAHSDRVAATLTPQHLLLNRNHLLVGGVHPHYYCLPVLKREDHRLSLLGAATSGESCFFAGTDSAPHPRSAKESACGCAGCFSAPTAVELYAEAFEDAGALDRLPNFLAGHGAHFYGLEPPTGTVTLVRERWHGPAQAAVDGQEPVIPLRAGEPLNWRALPRSSKSGVDG
jgi:dihydroorotase